MIDNVAVVEGLLVFWGLVFIAVLVFRPDRDKR